jgi:hypothetical protein
MSSTVDSVPHGGAKAAPAIAVVPLGLALSIFLAISFLLCALGDLIPWVQGFHFLAALYPDVDWTNPAMIAAGTVWAFLFGWYVALVFGPLYNLFAARRR